MVTESFPSSVRSQFAYLVDTFGFSVKDKPYGSKPFDDGLVEFWSKQMVVQVQLDRFDVMVTIGPTAEPDVARVSLQTAVEYLTEGSVTKIIDKTLAPMEYEARIKYQIATYASVLREYCASVLQGSFSEWLALSKFALKKMQDDYKRMTGKNLPDNQRLAAYIRAKSR